MEDGLMDGVFFSKDEEVLSLWRIFKPDMLEHAECWLLFPSWTKCIVMFLLLFYHLLEVYCKGVYGSSIWFAAQETASKTFDWLTLGIGGSYVLSYHGPKS